MSELLESVGTDFMSTRGTKREKLHRRSGLWAGL